METVFFTFHGRFRIHPDPTPTGQPEPTCYPPSLSLSPWGAIPVDICSALSPRAIHPSLATQLSGSLWDAQHKYRDKKTPSLSLPLLRGKSYDRIKSVFTILAHKQTSSNVNWNVLRKKRILLHFRTFRLRNPRPAGFLLRVLCWCGALHV